MHEFSICESLVGAVLSELKKIDPPATRLVTARVVVGALRQIVPDFLQTAYELLTKDTPAEGSTLAIRTVAVHCRCSECGWEGEVDPPFFQCPSCSCFKVETTSGLELYLEGLEVEQADG